MRTPAMIAILLAAPSVGYAERPRDVMHPVVLPPHSVPAAVDSHILYLNRCAAGCAITTGTTDSRTNHSDIPSTGGVHTLTAFAAGDTQWASVVSCIKTVMAPFNITVTDVDPGATVDHFEVMIAGSPGDLGLSNGIGGIADYPCQAPGQCEPYIPDALVFDFANVYGSGAQAVTYACGTAAQEIAHAWTLDHATGTSDPMTYNNYSTPLHYRDAAPCGSDCDYSCPGGSGSCNAFGVTCSGSGTAGTHACMGSGTATQDELKTITALFGPANSQPPVVAITSPANGSGQQAGFKIDATCTSSDSTVQEVDLVIDGHPVATLTAAPYNFTAPATLPNGSHTIAVTCTTAFQASATATATVTVGQLCTGDSDCTVAGDICFSGACVAGPTATGGLGTSCTGNSQCVSGQCASDGTNMYCVDPCDPTMANTCPSNFGCLAAGASGVCWPGADSGGSSGGGCNTSGNGGPILIGLGFAALLITRRRR